MINEVKKIIAYLFNLSIAIFYLRLIIFTPNLIEDHMSHNSN